jgi:hypothetical protein
MHVPLQKDATQWGLLVVSATLASHSVEEAKRYSANACYELGDESALPLKLVRGLLMRQKACNNAAQPWQKCVDATCPAGLDPAATAPPPCSFEH